MIPLEFGMMAMQLWSWELGRQVGYEGWNRAALCGSRGDKCGMETVTRETVWEQGRQVWQETGRPAGNNNASNHSPPTRPLRGT
ncbi:hypothetical protein Pmani_008092 [Petrolisthes manimaculis]|uniref:Uncharacterized protein n=1 Tax=Petrolisthes manimaculis TaxID=1843537 RepID=A0AAE1Q783_9EUCA|nr:hypothetical protein Pmani_008092 [Petrolisthes manimaculis]